MNGTGTVGPILFYRATVAERLDLAAVVAVSVEQDPPVMTVAGSVISARMLYESHGTRVYGYAFALPASGGSYEVNGIVYAVAGVSGTDLRLAYVACNGREYGDRERPLSERNALWQRLGRDHQRKPFHALLQGGDQLYADEMLDTHPALKGWRDGVVDSDADTEEIAERLRGFLLQRYLELYSQAEPAWLMARVPSLCMWDDHDICDGWGSLFPEQLDDAVGQTVFTVARELFFVFQLGAAPDETPPLCSEPSGTTLTWKADLPGVTLVAPDLRSERRPDRVMGTAGWAAFETAMSDSPGEHVFVLSSVPALGPRLSWVERVMDWLPGIQHYEDDLRDQWQSRAHRGEWRRFLTTLLTHHRQQRPVTLLSGEIHLATHGTMKSPDGPVHQLVSSGITHPPAPGLYARLLGWLARLGESPLPDYPIRLHPLPGQGGVYTAQRNYLVLEHNDGVWSAYWELERDGATEQLNLLTADY
jgi:hypothetical protein